MAVTAPTTPSSALTGFFHDVGQLVKVDDRRPAIQERVRCVAPQGAPKMKLMPNAKPEIPADLESYVQFLNDQRDYELALRAIRDKISTEPNNADAHDLLHHTLERFAIWLVKNKDPRATGAYISELYDEAHAAEKTAATLDPQKYAKDFIEVAWASKRNPEEKKRDAVEVLGELRKVDARAARRIANRLTRPERKKARAEASKS